MFEFFTAINEKQTPQGLLIFVILPFGGNGVP